MSRLLDNQCSYEDLLQLPGVGPKIAEQIMVMREVEGYIREEDLFRLTRLRVTPALLEMLDFNPDDTEDGPWVRGNQEDQGHQDMVRRVNDLVTSETYTPRGRDQGDSRHVHEAHHGGVPCRTPIKNEPSVPWHESGPADMDSAFLESDDKDWFDGDQAQGPCLWRDHQNTKLG